MNTAGSSNDAKAAGGYGNVEFNGLPATSNGYILDGYDTNDPWLGLNIGLSTNLVIGLDAVQEATVNTNSFAVDQGRYGASQVNYFTKSGTNQFHGDAYEVWNGSLLNAENYFLHANDTPGNIAHKPRSTVNEFGVSVGGPIRKDKLFFFAHYEGIRIALPIVSQTVVPSPGLSAICARSTAAGRDRPIQWNRLAGAAGRGWVLPVDVPALQQCGGDAADGGVVSAGCERYAAAGHGDGSAIEWEWLREPAAGVAQQQRPRRPDRAQDRPDHQREGQYLVSLPAGHWSAGCVYRSHQSDLQLVFAAAAAHAGAWVYAPLQSDAGEPVQPGRELVCQHL